MGGRNVVHLLRLPRVEREICYQVKVDLSIGIRKIPIILYRKSVIATKKQRLHTYANDFNLGKAVFYLFNLIYLNDVMCLFVHSFVLFFVCLFKHICITCPPGAVAVVAACW